MSHTVKANMTLAAASLDLMAAVLAERFNATFDPTATRFRFYGGMTEPCIGAITLNDRPDGYQVGLMKEADGSFTPKYDKFDGSIEGRFGREFVTVKDEMLSEAYSRELIREGFRVERTAAADGSIHLVMTR